jgi:hypothetical protein
MAMQNSKHVAEMLQRVSDPTSQIFSGTLGACCPPLCRCDLAAKFLRYMSAGPFGTVQGPDQFRWKLSPALRTPNPFDDCRKCGLVRNDSARAQQKKRLCADMSASRAPHLQVRVSEAF